MHGTSSNMKNNRNYDFKWNKLAVNDKKIIAVFTLNDSTRPERNFIPIFDYLDDDIILETIKSIVNL
jgi:hypothetical protein